MSTDERITRRGTLQPVVLEDAPAARIRLEPARDACAGCAAPCGGARCDEMLLAGPVLQAMGLALPAGAHPVRVSIARHGLGGAALALFGVPLAILLVGAVIGERMAEEGGSILLGYAALLVFLALLPWLSPRLLRGLALRVEFDDPRDRVPSPAPSSGQISEDTVS